MSADDHGSRSTYVHYHCRCDKCRAASTAYMFRRRTERARELVAGLCEVTHGTLSTYTNYRCRCRSCTTAKRSDVR